MKINGVWLFTNRNTAFFDEKGEQIIDLQGKISWEPLPGYDAHKVESALEQIIKDNPKIYIARWQDWRHEITIEEFCSLIGFGPWYWRHKKNSEETETE